MASSSLYSNFEAAGRTEAGAADDKVHCDSARTRRKYLKAAPATQRTHKPIYLFIINALSIAAQFFAPRAPH
jgi:hypothetical protein